MHRFGWIAVCGLLTATALLAAPIMPKTAELLDEEASLAGVKQFRVEVLATRSLRSKYGIETAKVEDAFKDRLREAGFEVVEDPDVPLCTLLVNTVVDPDQPKAVSLTASILVYQKVRVHRIGSDLTLPTATVQKNVLTTEARTEEMLFDSVSVVVDFLARMVDHARVKESPRRGGDGGT